MKRQLAFALVTVLVALMFAELLLWLIAGGRFIARTLSPPPDPGPKNAAKVEIYTRDEQLHHVLTPNASLNMRDFEFDVKWENNSLGLRGPEMSRQKPAGVRRVLLVGDSFTQGHGVEWHQTFGALLQAQFDQRGVAGQVVNAGVFGYSPVLESLWLEHRGPEFDPDVVVLGFFVGNDVGEDDFYLRMAQRDSTGAILGFSFEEEWPWTRIEHRLNEETGLVGRTTAGPRPARERPWWTVFRLGRLLDEVVYRSRTYREFRQRRQLERGFAERFTGDIQLNLGMVNYPGQEDRNPYWAQTLGQLDRIHAWTSERQLPLLLLIIPAQYQVRDDAPFLEPFARLETWAAERQIVVINLLDPLRAAGGDTYFEWDAHWTPAGHAVAATQLLEVLDTPGWLEPSHPIE